MRFDMRKVIQLLCLAAALLIGLVDTFGKVFVPDYAGVAIYVLMAAILLWRPEGLFRRA